MAIIDNHFTTPGYDPSNGFSIFDDFINPTLGSEVSNSPVETVGAYMLLQPLSQTGSAPDPADRQGEPEDFDNTLDIIGHVVDSFDFF